MTRLLSLAIGLTLLAACGTYPVEPTAEEYVFHRYYPEGTAHEPLREQCEVCHTALVEQGPLNDVITREPGVEFTTLLRYEADQPPGCIDCHPKYVTPDGTPPGCLPGDTQAGSEYCLFDGLPAVHNNGNVITCTGGTCHSADHRNWRREF